MSPSDDANTTEPEPGIASARPRLFRRSDDVAADNTDASDRRAGERRQRKEGPPDRAGGERRSRRDRRDRRNRRNVVPGASADGPGERRSILARRRGKTSSPGSRPPGKKKRRWQDIEITPEKVKRDALMNFTRQLSSFVRAGIPLIDGLAIIAEDASDKKLREVLDEVTTDLRAGWSFAEALSKHAVAFPRYFVAMIRSAELTGRLDQVLDQLSRYIERDMETRRKVSSAMTYPAVVLVMSLGTMAILSVFVLPKFADFFDGFDAKLPWATRTLQAITAFVGAWGVFMALAGVWLAMAFALATRREPGKYVRDRVYLAIPKVGSLLRTAAIERFCRILAVMVQAGVPLPDALTVASETTGNRVYRRGIVKVRAAIVAGSGMAGPIADSKLFPAAARQMIRVGEATGTLEEQLGSAAAFYGQELEYRLKRFTDLFEPAVVSFMGLVVGFVAYALVSAMYGVFGQIQT